MLRLQRVVQAREIWEQENDKLCAVEDVAAYCSYVVKRWSAYMREMCRRQSVFWGFSGRICFSFYMDRKNNTMIQQVYTTYIETFSKIN